MRAYRVMVILSVMAGGCTKENFPDYTVEAILQLAVGRVSPMVVERDAEPIVAADDDSLVDPDGSLDVSFGPVLNADWRRPGLIGELEVFIGDDSLPAISEQAPVNPDGAGVRVVIPVPICRLASRGGNRVTFSAKIIYPDGSTLVSGVRTIIATCGGLSDSDCLRGCAM